jgi:hypothetical protein
LTRSLRPGSNGFLIVPCREAAVAGPERKHGESHVFTQPTRQPTERRTFHVGLIHLHLITLGPDAPRFGVAKVRSYRTKDDPLWETLLCLPPEVYDRLEELLLDTLRWIRTSSADDFLEDLVANR